MAPDDLIALVKDTGLRGRGGAGFPTGMKWGFVPQNTGKPNYLVVNADESEPGACKDIPLLLANPHALVEGVIITCYAIRAGTRSSTCAARSPTPSAASPTPSARRTTPATSARTSSGPASTSTSWSTRVPAPTSAARRPRCSTRSRAAAASRRLKPPFPAVAGLYAAPTVDQQRRDHREHPLHRRATAWTGSGSSAPRSRRASSCSPSPATSRVPASTRRRWAPPCASSSTTPAASATATS